MLLEESKILKAPKKERKNKVNEIEKIYVEQGVYSKEFTRQLIDFIGFVLNRYSNENSFPDDMVHFTYLRVMERLGAIVPEKPKAGIRKEKRPVNRIVEIDTILEWELNGKKCLFDASRSNLGNYIFSISRHAHSNYTYHNSKKLKELKPPATEIPEPEISYNMKDTLKSKVLQIADNIEPEQMPESIRRYLLWKNV
uniref:Uncharacterized protein n=1 Tax=Siphoviridae sp. ctYh54 TaxID=2826379 RepID=A0A8S5MEC7_9CAUD|nr:MAG TPA: hypothetical protein [Siphoviridae sp. ctYh54]